MDNYVLPRWLEAAVAAGGGLGIFAAAFLDSTFVPLPAINDLLVIDLSMQLPARMPYYATMATLGSVLGCLVLYVLARKGGEAAFHRKAGERAPRIRRWIEQNGFFALLIISLLPPPAPFKLFVLGAGALAMPLRAFVMALVIARGVRFFGEGYLAVRYGPQAMSYLATHTMEFTIVAIAAVLLIFVLVRPRSRRGAQPQA
jgi:membrane protein YqaA with SNARE-associated domain